MASGRVTTVRSASVVQMIPAHHGSIVVCWLEIRSCSVKWTGSESATLSYHPELVVLTRRTQFRYKAGTSVTPLELREGAGRGVESVLNTTWEMHLTWGFLVLWMPWKPDLKDPGMESFNHAMVESLRET